MIADRIFGHLLTKSHKDYFIDGARDEQHARGLRVKLGIDDGAIEDEAVMQFRRGKARFVGTS